MTHLFIRSKKDQITVLVIRMDFQSKKIDLFLLRFQASYFSLYYLLYFLLANNLI